MDVTEKPSRPPRTKGRNAGTWVHAHCSLNKGFLGGQGGAGDGFRFLLPAAVHHLRQQAVAASHKKDLALSLLLWAPGE